MEDGKPVDGSVYIFAPNKGAPVFFTVAFAASGIFHFWQCYHYKCFKLTALQPFCCLLFTIGFALREYGSFNYDNLNIYIASTMFIYFSPPLLELANYHVLGRVFYYVPYCAPLHPGRVLTTFGTLSAIVEITNAIGVSYISNQSLPEHIIKVGYIFMKASLVIQVVVIVLFCLLAGIFYHRCSKACVNVRRVWVPLLTLYISTSIILARTIYRFVEHFAVFNVRHGPGFDLMSLSPIVRYEWFFYVFEASLMLINSILWNVWHPRRCLPEDYRTYLAQDGATELEGPGWKDGRPFIVTFVDSFCTLGMFGMVGAWKGKEQPFWETNGYGNVNNGV